MTKTTTVSVRLTEDDKRLIQHYAQVHALSSSELLKQATLEKIEDEVDLALYHQAMNDFHQDSTTYTPEEVDKLLGFTDV
ncbi:type II toxin-antitoxin system RelB family antitoxin [Staphylococcus pettenkoferi]|uniref:type II toxin-antitoxin system RelB family antitoxin n=1 Tax=Staphylococcus pettenkoferi TaxID=170573 RepID=UPI002556D920|nr:DUF6290 family protein [Staphylococcus pettenkoferi]MDK7284334.1 DUF6290 family protein [Staphylococcus pettenkoferi]